MNELNVHHNYGITMAYFLLPLFEQEQEHQALLAHLNYLLPDVREFHI